METIKKVSPSILVAVRKRPILQKEIIKNDFDIVDIRSEKDIVVCEPKAKLDLSKYTEEHSFTFDRAYDETASNYQIFDEIVRPLVHESFNGTKITIFAYGQTGSGKTFTMMGNKDQFNESEGTPGLFLLAAKEIYEYLENLSEKLLVNVSFYEIYCGKLFDLLNKRHILFLREDGKQNINIVGLIEKNVKSVSEIMEIISLGLNIRTTGITGANDESSRSHAILQISYLDKKNKIISKISFIDLAGSERGADTLDQNRLTRMDGAEINKSLLALKECIRALDHDQKHLPFRGSKLTLVLKDSFIGNCKTMMIANVSPIFSCCEHTLNTLRYADRVKELSKPYALKDNNNADKLSRDLLLPRQHSNIKQIEEISNQKSGLSPHPFKLLKDKKNKDVGTRPKTGKIFGINLNMKLLKSPKIDKQRIIGTNNKINTNTNEYFENSFHNQTAKNETNLRPKFIPNSIEQGSITSLKESGKNEENFDEGKEKLKLVHEKLIDTILNEEDELIDLHKTNIDCQMELSQEEMNLIEQVSLPGSNIDQYVFNLKLLLSKKQQMISDLQTKLEKFTNDLKLEEELNIKLTKEKK